MSSRWRSVLGIIAGIVVAMVGISMIQFLSGLLYPPPTNLNLNDRAALAAFIAKQPIGAWLLLILSYVIGTLSGAFLAALIARRAELRQGLIIGGIFLAGSIMNMIAIPHPLWFWVPGIAIFPICGYVGAKLAERLRPTQGPASTIPI